MGEEEREKTMVCQKNRWVMKKRERRVTVKKVNQHEFVFLTRVFLSFVKYWMEWISIPSQK